jgi:hypothetical protein
MQQNICLLREQNQTIAERINFSYSKLTNSDS